jgi:hypothetical protein
VTTLTVQRPKLNREQQTVSSVRKQFICLYLLEVKKKKKDCSSRVGGKNGVKATLEWL